MKKIALDLMGGDFAPDCTLKGIDQCLSNENFKGHIVGIGDEEILNNSLENYSFPKEKFTFIHAPETITMDDHPAKSVSAKKYSSINVGMMMLKEKKVGAFASAGNTGAMMVSAMFGIKTMEGVMRPGIAGFFPKLSGEYGIVLDAGANTECKPDVLNQFATLGSIYYKHLKGVDHPKIGLLNLGEEEKKGTPNIQATYQLMKINKNINFIGNIEGGDLANEKADVVICDGFVGNIVLKMGESIHSMLSKLGIDNDFVNMFNYESVGGSPIIGLNENVIIGHGKSTPEAIKSMLELSNDIAESGVTQKLKTDIQALETL